MKEEDMDHRAWEDTGASEQLANIHLAIRLQSDWDLHIANIMILLRRRASFELQSRKEKVVLMKWVKRLWFRIRTQSKINDFFFKYSAYVFRAVFHFHRRYRPTYR